MLVLGVAMLVLGVAFTDELVFNTRSFSVSSLWKDCVAMLVLVLEEIGFNTFSSLCSLCVTILSVKIF